MLTTYYIRSAFMKDLSVLLFVKSVYHYVKLINANSTLTKLIKSAGLPIKSLPGAIKSSLQRYDNNF